MIFSDGTFSIVPNLFKQLYTIHGKVYQSVVPLVYVLMPEKSQEAYRKVFNVLKELIPNFAPQTVMTDFEKGSINAYNEVFPSIQTSSCFFPLSQSVWRKHQSLPTVRAKYSQDLEYARYCRMIPALAFVHPSNVVKAFEQFETSSYIEKHD